jgi:hypothetical protein
MDADVLGMVRDIFFKRKVVAFFGATGTALSIAILRITVLVRACGTIARTATTTAADRKGIRIPRSQLACSVPRL